MQNGRLLPILPISRSLYHIDVDKQELRQVGNNRNKISFTQDMSYEGLHYRLMYDTTYQQKQAARPYDWYMPPSDIIELKIPAMIRLDPAGMSEKYHIPLDQLAGKSDYDLLADHETVAWRLSGQLPTVAIAGNEYLLDTANHVLVLKDNPEICLRFNQIGISIPWNATEFTYNTDTKMAVAVPPGDDVYRDYVLAVTLPPLLQMDPVGVAEEYYETCNVNDLASQGILMRYPVQRHIEASALPLMPVQQLSFKMGGRR